MNERGSDEVPPRHGDTLSPAQTADVHPFSPGIVIEPDLVARFRREAQAAARA